MFKETGYHPDKYGSNSSEVWFGFNKNFKGKLVNQDTGVKQFCGSNNRCVGS